MKLKKWLSRIVNLYRKSKNIQHRSSFLFLSMMMDNALKQKKITFFSSWLLVEWGVTKQLQYRIIHRLEKLQWLNDIENKQWLFRNLKYFRKNKNNQSLFFALYINGLLPWRKFFLAFNFYSWHLAKWGACKQLQYHLRIKITIMNETKWNLMKSKTKTWFLWRVPFKT